MLLSDVGVNFLVVPAGVFFLSFPKWYVVGNTANSSVRLGIILSYLERDTHWSGRNATRPIKLDMPCANVLLGFLHGVSRIPGWFRSNATAQQRAPIENARTRGLINVILSEAKNLGSIFERSFPGQMNRDVSLRST